MQNPLVHVCLAAALLLAADAATKNQELAPKGGRFAIQMPGEAKEQIQKLNTAFGPTDLHLFSVYPKPDVGYTVGYCDYPEKLIKKSSAEKILDGACDMSVQNLKGKLEHEKKITIDKYPGREIVVLVEDLAVRQRFYLVDNRLYQMVIVDSKELVTGKDAETFLNSFKLTDK